MSESRGTLYWHGGKDGTPIMGQIVPVKGKNGRDYDETKQGRFSWFPSSWPTSVGQDNALLAHVLTQTPQGPFGETVHHALLDGLRVLCTIMPDGTPLMHTIFPSWTGPETTGSGGAQGEYTYVGATTDKVK